MHLRVRLPGEIKEGLLEEVASKGLLPSALSQATFKEALFPKQTLWALPSFSSECLWLFRKDSGQRLHPLLSLLSCPPFPSPPQLGCC